jgi:hypothetical protein
MAKVKQYVFSARTTEEGLKRLSEVKSKAGVGWDEFVIEGMCGYYKLDKAILSLPKKEATVKEQEKKQPSAKKTAKKAPGKGTSPTGTGTNEPPPPEQ